jgi:hypothetical protein
MKKTLIILVLSIIFALFFIDLYFFFKQKACRDVISANNLEIIKSNSLFNNSLQILNESYLLSYISEDKSLFKDDTCKDGVKVKTSLYEKLNSSPSNRRLILLIGDQQCETCMEDQLRRVSDFGKRIGYDQVLVIALYNNDKQAQYFIGGINDSLPRLIIQNKKILNIDIQSKPSFFILDKSLNISHYVVCINLIDSYIDKYYSIIQEILDNSH